MRSRLCWGKMLFSIRIERADIFKVNYHNAPEISGSEGSCLIGVSAEENATRAIILSHTRILVCGPCLRFDDWLVLTLIVI